MWRGLYFRMGASGQQLVAANGSFPGTPIHPELALAGGVPPRWSPDGTRALVRDRDRRTFLYATDGSLRDLVLDPQGSWRWLTNTEVASIHQPAGYSVANAITVFVRADATTGQVLSTIQVPNQVQDGEFSPDGRWVAFFQPGPDRPAPSFTFELASQRLVKLTDGGLPRGWLPDGRVVLWLDSGGVELTQPDGTGRQRIFEGASTALADPRSSAIIVFSPAGMSRVTPGQPPSPVPASAAFRGAPLTISGDGSVLSFDEPLQGSSSRAGIVNLITGDVTYACDLDCRWLAIR
jgi:hypothetical protein